MRPGLRAPPKGRSRVGRAVAAGVAPRRSMRRLDSYTQRADHPVVFGIPETEYLRGYAVEVMGGW